MEGYRIFLCAAEYWKLDTTKTDFGIRNKVIAENLIRFVGRESHFKAFYDWVLK